MSSAPTSAPGAFLRGDPEELVALDCCFVIRWKKNVPVLASFLLSQFPWTSTSVESLKRRRQPFSDFVAFFYLIAKIMIIN
jgi:hypothetical protein